MATGGPDHGRTPARTALAGALAALVVAELATAGIGAGLAGLGPVELRDSFVATNAAIALSCAGAGLLVAAQRPRNPVGWLLLGAGGLQGATAATTPLLVAGLDRGWPQGAVRALATVANWAWPTSIALCLPLALLLFPDGWLPGRRWRPVVVPAALGAALFTAALGGDPAGLLGDPRSAAAVAVPGYAELEWLWAGGQLLVAAVYVTAVAGLVVRYRRGDERLRRQLLWLVLALVVVVSAVVVWAFLPPSGPQVLILLVIPLVPAAITVAVLRHGLLDIRLVLARAVLYALLTAGVGAAYLAVIAAADGVLSRAAGVEAAAYRIVVEALTNALRHAGASTVDVRLGVADGLEVEVVDDGGRAGDGPWRAGVGLRSIAERAAELGGTSEAGPVPGGGRVHARLPWGPA
jgi:fumarate reductase subunit D